jgi:hypothetical protein
MDDFVDRFYDATEWRERVATILEIIARDGLPNPRDLDVALDAIECEVSELVEAARQLAFEEAVEVVSKRAAERVLSATHCQSDRSRKHMHLRADEAGQIVALLKAKGDE